MKKSSFIAIIAIALVSVFGLTSCDKENDSIHQAITPKQELVTNKNQETSKDTSAKTKQEKLKRPTKMKQPKQYSEGTTMVLR